MDLFIRLEKAYVPGDLSMWFLVLGAKSFVEDSDTNKAFTRMNKVQLKSSRASQALEWWLQELVDGMDFSILGYVLPLTNFSFTLSDHGYVFQGPKVCI